MSSYKSRIPKVCILLLNWNGWKDTIECLESIFKSDATNFQVLICDNNSNDGSVEKIEAWAKGELKIGAANLELSKFVTPSAPKPIFTQRCILPFDAISSTENNNSPIKIIETGANRGFAGGNNCGLRYCLAQGDFDYVWLLNNDTVVSTDALSQLIVTMEENKLIGICGSALYDYWDVDRISVMGGKFYSPWSARVRANRDFAPPMPIDYVDGASMLVSMPFLQAAGLMDETYFLYFEELDWARAAAQKGFRLDFSPHSVVYHKEGASAGTNRDPAARGLIAERFLTRNRVYFTRRFYSWATPSVIAWGLLATLRALFWRDRKRARVIFGAILEGVRLRLP